MCFLSKTGSYMNPWSDDSEIHRRMGRFYLDGMAERRLGLHGVQILQMSCHIKWMERNWNRDATTYYVLHPKFEVVPEGPHLYSTYTKLNQIFYLKTPGIK